MVESTAPILSRRECEDCGAKLEWNGERWGCPACEERAVDEADARDRADEDRAAARADW
jgi:tRNA(Ile2) C34 agmatinyltransferase TiaS